MAQSGIIADLHSHTTASDGEKTPEELVDLAADAGLQALAVTDHDTLAGTERACARGKERGIEVICGCELTVYEREIELHILALFIDPASGSLAELLLKMQAHRRERALEIAVRLRAVGVRIEDADIFEAAGSAGAIGRPHVAAALVKRGHARTIQGAFLHFLRRGAPGYVAKYALRPEEAFSAVRQSGGVAILAHPGAVPHDELIAPLFKRGMDGIEVNHPVHSETNRRFYAGLARRYEKLVSGGSDYHGPRVRPGVQPGHSGVDRGTLEQLRRKAAMAGTIQTGNTLSG